MSQRTASAPGKIILSGEYAVVFGYPGIAIPYPLMTTATYSPETSQQDIVINVDASLMHPEWQKYILKIIDLCKNQSDVSGTLSIKTDLPVGRGMGSSTSVVIAVSRAILGNVVDKQIVRAIENDMNPGNSGLDFETIWQNTPIYMEGEIRKPITVQKNILDNTMMIVLGQPSHATSELVAWVKERREKEHLDEAFQEMAECAKALIDGKSLIDILPKHHRAQIKIGVVPELAQKYIARVEELGGAAKVLGAGSRTGGAGALLLCGLTDDQLLDATLDSLFQQSHQ